MKNLPASIKDRLSNQAKQTGVSLQSLLERFVIGRLLWRVSQSKQSDRFVLKGAQLFTLWADQPHRPTRDIDFLAYGDPSIEAIESFFTDLLRSPATPDDGLIWSEIKVSPIREENHYGGTRVNITAMLDRTRIITQVDIGFGDAITPLTESHTWKGLLDFPEARLLTYPPETVIAEKLQAAVELQLANSRMKDLYDLEWLHTHRNFNYETLRQAILNTFERRQTPIPQETPIFLTTKFSQDPNKITQWNAFLRKNKFDKRDLTEVIQELHTFLNPLLFTPSFSIGQWIPNQGWL